MSDEPKTPPSPEWEQKSTLGINEQLKKVLLATKVATEAELAQLRRKLEKLQRGS